MEFLVGLVMSHILSRPVYAVEYPTPIVKPMTALEFNGELAIEPEPEASSTKPIILDDPLFEAIAECESGNNPKAKNPNSSASGRFQFIKKSWNYYGNELWGDDLVNKDVFDYEDNTELAWYVYKRNGTVDWEESRHCWGVHK